VSYGVSSSSISNGWPGPQPVSKSKTAAAKINKIVVLKTFLPKNIRHFLLRRHGFSLIIVGYQKDMAKSRKEYPIGLSPLIKTTGRAGGMRKAPKRGH